MKNRTKYEISDYNPSWIDNSFPNDDEYEEVKEVIKFYLINTPCDRSSSRGTDISAWGKPSIVLFDKLKNTIGLTKGINYDHENAIYKMKELFDNYHLGYNFLDHKQNCVVFLTEKNVYDSLFRHIRNSIAHSRWQVYDSIYYFEDGKDQNVDGTTVFCVTARIVLSKEALLNLRDIIIEGPSLEEQKRIHSDEMVDSYLHELIKEFSGKRFRRKDAVTLLKIDNEIWKKVYKKGKREGLMKYRENNWRGSVK